MTTDQKTVYDLLPATRAQLCVELNWSARKVEHVIEHMKSDGLVWFNKTDGKYERATKLVRL